MADYVLGVLYESDEGGDALTLNIVTFNGTDGVDVDPDDFPGAVGFVDVYSSALYAEDENDPRFEDWKQFFQLFGETAAQNYVTHLEQEAQELAKVFSESFAEVEARESDNV